jgi:HEAT repeat protein
MPFYARAYVFIAALCLLASPVFGAGGRGASLEDLAREAKSPRGETRRSALKQLVLIGPEKGIEPIVAAWHENFRAESDYIGALAAIGPKGIPVLLKLLKKTPDLKFQASRALYFASSPAAPENIPGLLACVAEAAEISGDCGMALAKSSSPKAAKYVKELLSALKGKSGRSYAAMALGNIGPKADAAVPALCKAAGDREAGLKISAVIALGNIGGQSEELTAALQKALADFDPNVARKAKEALIKLGKIAPEEAQAHE